MAQKKTNLLVATFRNEGPYILEWIAYHKLIGFDAFLIFSNDCNDGTSELLDAVQSTFGFVSHFRNDEVVNKPGRRHNDPQRRAYRWASQMSAVHDADYVMVLDSDEFLAIKPGAGRLADLYRSTGPFDAMSVTWRLFGCNGVYDFEDRLVIEQFTHARPDKRPKEVQKWAVKTLFRPNDLRVLGVHQPKFGSLDTSATQSIRWVNGSGHPVTECFFKHSWRVNRKNHGSDLAEIHHYALRSVEGFLMKRQRGSANTTNSNRVNGAYFRNFNHNEERVSTLDRWIEPVRSRVESWLGLHPQLLNLHTKTVAYHKQEIRHLAGELTRDEEMSQALQDAGITDDHIELSDSALYGKS